MFLNKVTYLYLNIILIVRYGNYDLITLQNIPLIQVLQSLPRGELETLHQESEHEIESFAVYALSRLSEGRCL